MTEYLILQWTPFPNDFVPMPMYQLQMAEFDLFKGRKSYHENARRVGEVLLYNNLEEAQAIANYWAERWPWAKHKVEVVNHE